MLWTFHFFPRASGVVAVASNSLSNWFGFQSKEGTSSKVAWPNFVNFDKMNLVLHLIRHHGQFLQAHPLLSIKRKRANNQYSSCNGQFCVYCVKIQLHFQFYSNAWRHNRKDNKLFFSQYGQVGRSRYWKPKEVNESDPNTSQNHSARWTVPLFTYGQREIKTSQTL